MNSICGCWRRKRYERNFEAGKGRRKMTERQDVQRNYKKRRENPGKEKTVRMTAAGLFAAMITVMTAYICHIPYGANGGYIHFGDAMIYMAAVFLPRPYALAAAAIGGGAADLLTAPMWAPATIIIKMLIVLPFTGGKEKILTARNWAAPFIAAVISAFGYYLAEGILFGSFVAPAASLLGSFIQSGGSAVFFFAAGTVFDQAHVKGKVMRMMHPDGGAR